MLQVSRDSLNFHYQARLIVSPRPDGQYEKDAKSSGMPMLKGPTGSIVNHQITKKTIFYI
jgi:hypothetical protein